MGAVLTLPRTAGSNEPRILEGAILAGMFWAHKLFARTAGGIVDKLLDARGVSIRTSHVANSVGSEERTVSMCVRKHSAGRIRDGLEDPILRRVDRGTPCACLL